jgi:hypothetical protein
VLIETRKRFRRHAGCRGQAVPAGYDVVRKAAFLRRRHIAQQRIALLAGGRNDPDLVIRDHRLQSGIEIESDVDIATQHRRHEVGRCLKRNDCDIYTAHLLQEMRG